MKSLWEILVPSHSNTNEEYSLEHHHIWDAYVRNLSGGLTVLKTAKGQWVSLDEQLFHDVVIPVRIYCSEENIDDIIQFTIKHYDQEAVLAYEVSPRVKLVHK